MQIYYKIFSQERSAACGMWNVFVGKGEVVNKIREIDVVIVVARMWQRRAMYDVDISV